MYLRHIACTNNDKKTFNDKKCFNYSNDTSNGVMDVHKKGSATA